MSHIQTSRPLTLTVQPFPLPKTRAEFDALTFPQKLTLHEQEPESYARLAKSEDEQ